VRENGAIRILFGLCGGGTGHYSILSSRVFGVWGTIGFDNEMMGFRIIFGIVGFRKWREGNYRYLHCENTRNDYRFVPSIQVLSSSKK